MSEPQHRCSMVAIVPVSDSAPSVTTFSLREMAKDAGSSKGPLKPASLTSADTELLDAAQLSPEPEPSPLPLYLDDDLFSDCSQASSTDQGGQEIQHTKKSKKNRGKEKGKAKPCQQNPTRQIKYLAGELIKGQNPRIVAGRMLDLAEEAVDPLAEDHLDMVAKVVALEHRVETLEAMLDMHLDRMALFERKFEQMDRF